MTRRAVFGAVALLAASAMISGCGRDEPPPAPNVPPVTTPAPVAPEVRQETREMANQAERGMEKAGAVFDDATITAKVKTALIAEPGLKGMAIDVDTSNNVVSLTGAVQSDAAKMQAEQIARRTEGVKEVKNNLTIKPAT